MSISEKITELKKIISMVCDVVPLIVEVVKEVILLIKDVKAV